MSSTTRDLEIPLGKRTRWYRFFEILPAVLSFSLLALPIALALINPIYAAIFIVLYIISYIVRALAMAARVLQSYNTMQEAQKIDWQARLEDLKDVNRSLASYHNGMKVGWHVKEHRRNLARIAASELERPQPQDVINVVIIATYNEAKEVLEPTVQAVAESSFPAKQTILVVAYEERGPESTRNSAHELVKAYHKTFKAAFAIGHPNKMPNEVVGKGGNITYAAKWVDNWLAEKKINKDNVIVTTLDSDNRPHPSYFSYLAYEFIVTDRRHNVSYQPIALFLSNIWDVPAPMRVLATGNSFWNMINSLRPHMLRNFASHSQSFASLQHTNFWSTRTIVEDGHQFWRSYFAFKGKYEVVPIYVPIYQDAVLSDTYAKTLKAQFIQLRRWAYGASDIPYVATRVLGKNRTVPFWDGLAKLARLIDGHVSWATTPILLAFSAWIPLFIAPEASLSIVAQRLPDFASTLQTIALIGLFINIFLAMKMLPPRPERYKRRRNLWMLLQWVLMPVTAIIYGSSSAVNSQMRLLLGRYLDKFDVTDKTIITESASGAVKHSSSK